RQEVPATLGDEIEALIRETLHARPDLAAGVAAVRLSEAGIDRAKAEFTPEVDVLANYGEQNWGYTFNAAPQIQANMPEYTALVALKWDIFVGFSRVNALREADARRAASVAELQSRELVAIAEVWRAYYEFQSSRKRYEFAKALLRASQESY